MRFYYLSIFLFIFSLSVNGQQSGKQKEVLLIGLFHFNNPGADLAKTDKFDVMTPQSQKELEIISDKIKQFNPDKIFTEWNFDDQEELDSLYDLYLNNEYFEFAEKKYPENAFYKENEIFQLGFRIAKKNNLKRVYGIDVEEEFPFDSVMIAIDKANQKELKQQIFDRIKSFETMDNEYRKNHSLTELIINENSKEQRDLNLGSYISLFNPGGNADDFSGADLVTLWYKRNLRMYSLMQKLTEKSDDKIVVILGAGHAALFKHFIDLDENYKVIELKDVLAK